MATWGLLSFCVGLCIIPHCLASLFLEDLLGNADSCESICENTYPLHTYDKSLHLGYCRRGCRLFNIIDFVDEFNDLNLTRESCSEACKEAYQNSENQDPCIMGCEGQLTVATQKHQQIEEFPMDQGQMLFPIMYLHSMYSNMVEKLSNHFTVSWSFYMQNDNGQMVVIKSGPHYESDFDGLPFADDADYKTSNYMETNLAEVDNSATPNLKSSQVHAMDRDAWLEASPDRDGQPADWLGCIAKKTGMPRLLLTLTIFLSAMVMIWLCVTTAVTAPEHRIHAQPQKLSIYGDLEYLREVSEKGALAAVHKPRDPTLQAAALPIKIKIERI